MFDLVKTCEMTRDNIVKLECVKNQIKTMSTSELAHGFQVINPVEKGIEQICDLVKEELKQRMQADHTGAITQDEKGHLYFTLKQGKLKAEKREKKDFDTGMATTILEKKGLLKACQSVSYEILDPDTFAQTLSEVLAILPEAEKKTYEAKLMQTLREKRKLSEALIESAVEKGQLSLDEVEEMHSVRKTYALKIVKG